MSGLTASIAVVLVVVCLSAIAFWAWKPFRARQTRLEIKQATQDFRLQRELLEAKFFNLAVRRGKPRGLRWIDCEWLSPVKFARDLNNGLLTAFVAVNISFEAVEGSDMEDVEAVDTLREAAAVFHYSNGRWGTGGRALFNMNPGDAVMRLDGQFEPVSVDTSTA